MWPTSLEWFDDGEAREALIVPAAERGVDFDEEALELPLCDASVGSPLEIQRLRVCCVVGGKRFGAHLARGCPGGPLASWQRRLNWCEAS